ncbi:MAG TPA: hypothetical protein VMT08_17365 [Bradyrhizobium sp.]|nr:hypothetical protein [Bradyrhizobium sp.]
MSGIHDRHVRCASGVLTTMQRGGNALGVAALEVPFFLTLSGAGSRGLSQTASYVQAFGAVAFWNVLMLLTSSACFSSRPTGPQPRHNQNRSTHLSSAKDGLNDRFAPEAAPRNSEAAPHHKRRYALLRLFRDDG